MKYASLIAVLLLAACGAEAPPRHAEVPEPGVSVSGEVRIGVKTTL